MNRFFFNSAIFRLVAPAVYGLILYLLILLINNNVTQVKDLFVTQELYVCILLTYLSFEVIRAVIQVLQKAPKGKSPGLLIAAQLAATVLISVGLVMLCLVVYFDQVVGFSISTAQLTIFAALFTVTAVLYNLLYFSYYYLNKQNVLQIDSEKQQRAVLEMEMAQYQNDINPDLLYESLENVIALMYRDVDKAEDYIDTLGSAYRYILTNRQNELVSLSDELEAARNIIRLLNEKYGGLLAFKADFTDDELEAMLIPGSLPVILDSIIRNTIITRFEPFVIHCYCEDGYVTVETRLNDRLIIHDASEDAFTRLQRSYAIFTEQPLIRVKAYEQNYVKLPLIRVTEEA